MSNVKISELPAASSAAGTDELPANQSGTTRKLTRSQIVAGLAASGAVTSSGLTMTTARVLGRTTASTGTVEEISVGSGLSLSAGSITNAAPDQTVSLTQGTGISVTGTYPAFTIAATNNGTVTSVALSGGSTGLTVSGSPITTSGTITIAGTLDLANGGTGATTAANARTNLGLGTAATMTGPSGTIVGTTDTQTLTAKTLGNYTETVFGITDGTTVNLDPNNGPIQTWTLGANRTPGQANWAAGQSITLMIDDGTARTITWTTLAVVWKTGGGTAPTLQTTGFTVIALWKVGTTIYGARVGDA